MKRIKRLVALIGVVLFVSSAPMTAYAKADNFVLNTGAVVELITSAFASTPHGATVVLLGMLGITIGGAIGENLDTEAILNWGQKRMDELYRFIDNAGEELSITKDAMGMWLTDVGNGMLDTTSECWDAFLDYCCWLEDKATDRSDVDAPDVGGGLVVGGNFGWSANFEDFSCFSAENKTWYNMRKAYGFDVVDQYPYDYYPDYLGVFKPAYCSSQYWLTGLLNCSQRYGAGTYDLKAYGVFFNSRDTYDFFAYLINPSYKYIYGYGMKDGSLKTFQSNFLSNMEYFSQDGYVGFSNVPFFTDYDVMMDYLEDGQISLDDWDCVSKIPVIDGYTFNTNFELVVGTEWPQEVSIPKPGDTTDDVDDVVVGKPTSDIIDRDGDLDNVRVGDATGEVVGVIGIPVDGIGLGEVATPYVGVPGVYPVDTVTGEIVGTDTPIEDVTPEKVPTINGAYTIDGLEDVFPFCVPFDLIDLFSVLSAEPQAPKIKFPLPVPDGNMKFHYEYIEIDLSKFDAAAKVLRAMEFLAFCIGLTLVTRKLIRG